MTSSNPPADPPLPSVAKAEPTTDSASGQPPASAPTSASDAILTSLLQPGLNPPLQHAMNLSFVALLLVLFGLAILTAGDGHVVFVLCTTVALWLSLNWFLAELAKLPPAQIDAAAQTDRSAAPAPVIATDQRPLPTRRVDKPGGDDFEDSGRARASGFQIDNAAAEGGRARLQGQAAPSPLLNR